MHKDTIIEKHRVHETDTGSSEVQIALLTSRITAVTEHMNTHKKDFHSRRGLLAQVARRRRLLNYLKVNHPERHKKITEALGLRK